MTQKQNELKNQLAGRAQQGIQTQEQGLDPARQVNAWLQQLGPQLERALPRTGLTADRLARIALTTIRTNPKLLLCSKESLMSAVMTSAQLGLEPGVLGHAYIIPYKNKKKVGNQWTWVDEAQFQIGYKGMLDLVRRSGEITSISAHEVHENDHFEFEYGINEKLEHRPNLKGDRGEVYCYYAYAKYKDGGYSFFVMSRADVEKFARTYSKAAVDKDTGALTGVWKDEFHEMAKKTVLKKLMKYMPISTELQRKLSADETIRTDFAEDMMDVQGQYVSPDAVVIDADYDVAQQEAFAGQTETAAGDENASSTEA